MTAPGSDPLPRLAEALVDVSSRLREIGDELRAVHPAAAPFMGPPPFRTAPPFATAPPHLPPPPPHLPPFPTPPPHLPPPRRPSRPPGPSLRERLGREGAGSKLLAWVGGAVTLAGVVLLLVLAVQRGYLGPLPRVLLGAGLGSVLVGVALVLHRNPAGRIGAHAVAATGVAVLYLDVLAATSVYRYLPLAAGLVVGLGVAGVGVAIAARWDSQPFAGFVVLGAALGAPVLTGGIDTVLVGFLLVLQLATAPVHVVRRWTLLAVCAAVPANLAVLLLVSLRSADAAAVLGVCTVAAAAQIVLAGATAVRSPSSEAGAVLVTLAPTPVFVAAVLGSHRSGAVVLAVLGAVLAAVWAARQLRLLDVGTAFGSAAGIVGALAGFEALGVGLAGGTRAAALLAAGTLLTVLADRVRQQGVLVVAAGFGAAGGLLALTGPARASLLVAPPAGTIPGAAVAALAVTGALSAGLAIAVALVSDRLAGSVVGEGVRWAVLGAAGLYGGTAAVLSLGLLVEPDGRGFVLGHVLVTVSWTLAALVLLLRDPRSTPLRVTGLTLVAAAVAKLALFDLSSLSGIPRVLAFLGAGLMLLAAGARYARVVHDAGAFSLERNEA